MSEDDRFVIECAISRIAELNRTLLGYRVFYAAILGAFFTALSFVSGVAENASFLRYPDAYALVVCLLVSATLAAATIAAFLDFLHQDFIEDCVSNIRFIEKVHRRYSARAIFNRKRKPIAGVRLNITIVLFYSLPIFTLFVAVYLICGMGLNVIPLQEYVQVYESVLEYCKEGIPLPQDPPQQGCEAFLLEFQFADGFKRILPLVLYVCSGFVSYYIFFAGHRIIRRAYPVAVSVKKFRISMRWRPHYDRVFNDFITVFSVVVWTGFFVLMFSEIGRETYVKMMF
ncbi:hypothetical protein [Falsiruegeria mediterranea]|uniref:Uncharacterized protein n=1 Tax=Falsiruegeria mediterranea M17 TaxID=1200281 RepID=A0A2R8C7W0_9RHOB|nr:hypothetical protein TRM7615_01942 [Falsiruegeria mediterranea M17]